MQKATFDLPMYFDGATTPNDLGSGRLHITLDYYSEKRSLSQRYWRGGGGGKKKKYKNRNKKKKKKIIFK